MYAGQLAQICCGMQVLAAANVVHFDLKCDNILLEAAVGASEAEFWLPASARPPFRVVLADFGESRMYSSAQGAVTVRCAAPNALRSITPESFVAGLSAGAAAHEVRWRERSLHTLEVKAGSLLI